MSDETPMDETQDVTEEVEGTKISRGTKTLLVATALGVCLFVAALVGLVYIVASNETPEVLDESVLYVALSGPLADAPQQPGLFDEAGDMAPLPTEIAQSIRRAADDDRVTSLLIELEAPAAGWATWQELRSALVAYRESGKPCVVWSDLYATGSYYFASACDTVLLAPSGITQINGLSIDITYYSELFEKIGVEAEFVHVGEFKSAVEPYERTTPSESAAEAYEGLVDALYGEFVSGVASSRGMTVSEFKEVVDAFPMSPQRAKSMGLIDGIAYRDGLYSRIGQAGTEGFLAALEAPITRDEMEDETEMYTDIEEYVAEQRMVGDSADTKIAVIYAEGQIMTGAGSAGLFGGSDLTDGEFEDWMWEARNDDAVKAVVLRVNSPGGSGLASDMMLRQVEITQALGIPVVVSMGDYAASGGYYISCSSDWIVAQPTTLTGSIGVFAGKFNLAGVFEKLGLGHHHFYRGATSSDFALAKPFSEQGKAAFQSYVDDFYQVFIGHVAKGRGLSLDEVDNVGQGRVWTGAQALERGLVDELGGLDVAVAKAVELAELDEYQVVVLPRQKTLMELLLEDFSQSSMSFLTLLDAEVPVGALERPIMDLLKLEAMLAGNGIAALIPGQLVISDGSRPALVSEVGVELIGGSR